MSTTFLIGNGFDVHLGLKTKFSDFFDTYIDQNMNTENEHIKKFCNSLQEEKNENNGTYENWSDFEGAFPKYVTSQEEIRSILGDFTEKFCNYLDKVDSNVQPNEEIIQQFNSFVFGMHGVLSSRNGRISVSDKKINFINFNYTHNLTHILTSWVDYYKNSDHEFPAPNILHIHGTRESGIIIGIDNLKQLDHEDLQTPEVAELCVKLDENQLLENDTITPFKRMVDGSSLIITYGISFGVSDATYWRILTDWLIESNDHKLVVYMYDSGKFNKLYHGVRYPAGKADFIDVLKNLFLMSKPNIYEYIRSESYSKLREAGDVNAYLLSHIYIADSDSVLNFKMYEEPSSQTNNNKEALTT